MYICPPDAQCDALYKAGSIVCVTNSAGESENTLDNLDKEWFLD